MFEYFCKDCGQLRLAVAKEREGYLCANCNSNNITTGDVNALNKEALKDEWRKNNESNRA